MFRQLFLLHGLLDLVAHISDKFLVFYGLVLELFLEPLLF